MADITNIGGRNTSGGQLTPDAFLETLLEYQSNEIAFEENLNKLKITNVENLGALRKQAEKDLLKVVELANKAQTEKFQRDKEKKERAEHTRRVKELEKLSSKEQQLARAIEAARHKEALKNIKAEQVAEEKYANKKSKRELEEAKKKSREAGKAQAKEDLATVIGKGATLAERRAALGNMFTTKKMRDVIDPETGKKIGEEVASEQRSWTAGLMNLTSALSDFSKKLEGQIDEIAGKKSAIDTRLQGSKMANKAGSYWDKMSSEITGIAGISPLVKQSAIVDRVSSYVAQGIAFNVEQRAVLQELSAKIANTFNAADSTLLRLIRIQQQDTTAGRLGMESALTAFLNNMYETTEYMQGIASTIKGSLEEAMSLMSGENALSFEYQIQKWLGSMYSVGMSQSAVQGLGGVLGKLAAGQLEAITQGGQGNLVIMAANQAGLNISDILNQGLTQETTNELLTSMVEYLAKIYNEAGNSKVIQQQFAQVYGLSASDLKAAFNLSKSVGNVEKSGLDYAGAISRLTEMAGSMYSRTSIGEMMTNAWDNFNYTMAAGIANNPVMYGLYKIAGLLKDTTGGIEFGLPLVAGTGMTQTFNVADIMRTAAMAGGIVSGLVNIIGAGGGGGITGNGILRAAGVTGGISQVTRGTGLSRMTAGGAGVSASGAFVGNQSSSDMMQSTMTSQTEQSKAQTANAADESSEVTLGDVNKEVVAICEILRHIAAGDAVLNVAVPGGLSVNNFPDPRM